MSDDRGKDAAKQKRRRAPLPDPWPEPEHRAVILRPEDAAVPANARRAALSALRAQWPTSCLTLARGTVAWEEQARGDDPSDMQRVLASTRVVTSVVLWLDDGRRRGWAAWEDGRAAASNIDGVKTPVSEFVRWANELRE